MSKFLPTVTVLIVLVTSGVVHGLWTDRWSRSADLAEAASRLENLPENLGDWQGGSLQKLDRSPQGLAGAVTRRYAHRLSGMEVTVYLACGRGGPVSIHSPDVCYPASGYVMDQKRTCIVSENSKSDSATFLSADLRKSSVTETSRLRAYWSWHCEGQWVVSDTPRFAFVRQPVMHKLYLIREVTSVSENLAEDPCVDLAEHLLPVLRRAVLSSTGRD